LTRDQSFFVRQRGSNLDIEPVLRAVEYLAEIQIGSEQTVDDQDRLMDGYGSGNHGAARRRVVQGERKLIQTGGQSAARIELALVTESGGLRWR
jgi:hypothetical protein